jgi:hypothetical protein
LKTVSFPPSSRIPEKNWPKYIEYAGQEIAAIFLAFLNVLPQLKFYNFLPSEEEGGGVRVREVFAETAVGVTGWVLGNINFPVYSLFLIFI